MSKPTTSASPEPIRRQKGASKDRNGMTPANWARLRSKTNEEVVAAALADPDAQPRTKAQLARSRRISRAKFIRQRLGMSQDTFATTFGIPLGTLRDWEQHRREPDQAARAYLEVIARAPDAVRKALAQSRELATIG